MPKFNVGDKVCFIEDKEKRTYTVGFIFDNGKIELEEFGMTSFPKNSLKLVKRCPYQPDDQVKLIAVYWVEEEKRFETCEVTGKVSHEGCIEFSERVHDHYGVSVNRLNTVRTADMAGVDYDCAFCEPGEDNIRKVKLEYLRMMTSKVESLKEDYDAANNQLMAMRQQIGG
jgi:hypothetical protein